jgi:F-type H+-transporting ATPase subunit O
MKLQVPLALFGGSGNYASALYIAAVKTNALDKIESELHDLVEAMKRSPTFSLFTKDPTVPADTRLKAIQEIAGGAKFSEVTKNFLGMMSCTLFFGIVNLIYLFCNDI